MGNDGVSAWTKASEALAAAEQDAVAHQERHYRAAATSQRSDFTLGLITVTLSAFAAVWVLWLSEVVGVARWLILGAVALSAGASAALQASQRYVEYAEEHRELAESWAAIRREISQMRALHPTYQAARLDASTYLEDLDARRQSLLRRGVHAVGRARWRAIADQQRAELFAATLAVVGGRDAPPFSSAVRALLEDWERRTAASSYAHLALAERFSTLSLSLGIPAVLLAAIAAGFAYVFHGDDVPTWVPLVVGGASLLLCLVAATNTFLRPRERAQQHGISAERWAALRREIVIHRTLDPSHAANNPTKYLDDLRGRMDRTWVMSPEIGDRWYIAAVQQERATVDPEDASARFEAVFPGVYLKEQDSTTVAAPPTP